MHASVRFPYLRGTGSFEAGISYDVQGNGSSERKLNKSEHNITRTQLSFLWGIIQTAFKFIGVLSFIYTLLLTTEQFMPYLPRKWPPNKKSNTVNTILE